MSGEGKVVCVTGASGYIASWSVKLLLLRRYTVHATVRTLDDPKKTEHLLSLEGANARLRLFKADLTEADSFDSAINGCHGVFHTASPCFFRSNDPQADLIDPAVNGTINVNAGRSLSPEVVVDDTWFSDASDAEICRKQEKWYPLSKLLAEEAAWKFAKEKGIDLVVMNPAWVIGPLLQPTLNESSAVISNLVGSETYPNNVGGWVHVKDAANAHIQAFEVESANGRYCLVERIVHYSDIVKILRESYPTLEFPDRCVDDNPPMLTWKVSKDKARSLGIDFTPLEVCLQDTIQSLKDKNFI